jgi:hypothetical protein
MRPFPTLVLIVLSLSACGRSAWKQTSQEMSPDQKYMAVAEYKDAPASNSDHRRVRLVEINGTASPSGETVVTSENSDRAVLYWEGNDHLIVEVCGATSYEVKARHFREPMFNENGAENAIRIEAAATGGIRNGRQLCASLPTEPPAP